MLAMFPISSLVDFLWRGLFRRLTLILCIGTMGIVLSAPAPGTEAAPGAAPHRAEMPASQEQIRLSFAPVVRKAAPAVVNITAQRIEREIVQAPLFADPFFRRFFGDDFGFPAPERERVRSSLGSGVIVDPAGLIVTNEHVIKGADQIRVSLADRRVFDAELVLADSRTDLAVLRITEEGITLPALAFGDSDTLDVGDLVLAIGNPFGVGQTVTSGIVSALARTMVGITDFRFFIQTDAAINPGNSGGALVTMDGRLVGINTAIYSQTGGSIGIGFAVPSNMVRAVLDGMEEGRVIRPWLGADSQGLTSDLARSLNLETPEGVLVTRVLPGSPAAQAGLRPGDVILAVNDRSVFDPEGLRFRFATLGVGGMAHLLVYRDGAKRLLQVPLAVPPETPPRDQRRLEGNHPLNGATIVNLSPALTEELQLPHSLEGVMILGLDRGSFAARAGLQPGDLIRSVNGETVATGEGLVALLSRLDGAPRWRLGLERGGRALTLSFGG